MWCRLVACLLLVFSTCQSWEVSKKYEYIFRSRIFQDDKEIATLAVGLFQFKWDSQNLLTGRFKPKYEDNKANSMDYFSVPKESFQVLFKAGQVTELKVSEDTTPWMVEFIRGMLGLLQVSDLAQTKDKFSIMEESVAGKCKTYYTVTREPDGIEIVKTRNYTDCEKTPFFGRGVFGTKNYDALMKNRDIIARDTRAEFLMNEGHEILDSYIREDIQIVSNRSTIKFSTEIDLWIDSNQVDSINAGSDDDDFVLESLISVGGLMYRPSYETDYYMNPKRFDKSYNGNEVEIAKLWVEQIALELKTPSELPEKNTLDKFTVLVGVIRYMNLKQLDKVAKFCNGHRLKSFVFQSAIIQAGTLENLEMIRILKKRDEWRTDSVNIGGLPEKVHPLSLEYLDSLFEFATDPELPKKDFDFWKDLFLAFNNLLRRYLTEKGNPFKEEQLNKLIATKYRKHLSKKLQTALDNENNLEFQVYVRALGNMADWSLFSNFWIRNYNKLTTFQKSLIINSMDNAVAIYPPKLRDLLMEIYGNETETYSVRIAAVYKLLKTNLPEDMVVDIIEIAEESGNGQIQNAVKTSILSEGYDYYSNKEINRMAQSIKVNREGLPMHKNINRFSESAFWDLSYSTNDILFLTERIIGLDENPFSLFSQGRVNKKGFQTSFKYGGIIDYVHNYIGGLITKTFDGETSSGNIEVNKDFYQKFIPFVNLRSPMDLVKHFSENKNLKSRLLQMEEVVIGFPTECGLPFVYIYQSPYLEDYKVATHIEDTISADFNLRFSIQEQTKMGFANPMTGKHYVYGFNIIKQVHLPFTVSYTYPDLIVIDPLFWNENSRLIHFSTWPYTGVRSLFPVDPVAKDENIVFIQNENPFKNDFYLDESETFRVKIVSSGGDAKRNIFDFSDKTEMKSYASSGPFEEVRQTHNIREFFLKDDPDNPTSLSIKLDLSDKNMSTSHQTESAGNIKGPFLFMGGPIFKVIGKVAGRTDHSFSLELNKEIDLISNEVYKISLKGSYSENDVNVYDTCLDIYVKFTALMPLYHGDSDENENEIVIFTKLRFGPTCDDGAFISSESEIEVDNLLKTSTLSVKNAIDFHGIPTEIAKRICELEGDYNFLREGILANVKINVKYPIICDYLMNKTKN